MQLALIFANDCSNTKLRVGLKTADHRRTLQDAENNFISFQTWFRFVRRWSAVFRPTAKLISRVGLVLSFLSPRRVFHFVRLSFRFLLERINRGTEQSNMQPRVIECCITGA